MEIVTTILSKVGEYLVEPTINQARYLFRFKQIVEDLTKAERNLKSKQRDVEEEIKAAERNDEKIKATVQDWLSDSRKIMGEVETLKGKIEVNKTCLNGWCPNWGSRHQLGRIATKTSIQLKEIIDKGQFERVGCRALLSGEPSAPKDPAPLSAREVRKTVKEKGIFKDVVMATVSQTPNFRNIQGQLADFLDLKLTQETEEGRAQKLSSRLSNSNNNLIILDDVWEEFDFEEKIGVPLSKEEHEGVALLKRQACLDDDCDDLNTLATRIARECDGLPLALVTIGREKGWKQYTAISLLENKLKELSVRLVCPKLKLLLLGGENQWSPLKVSDECFQEMKALEVVNKLEILSFRGSRFDELPIELSELKELRMLDLRKCYQLKRIPSNLIRSFSQLEELYMEKDIFEEREVEEKSIETGNARLSEINCLSRLAVLYLKINSKCLPKDFAFSKLSRYEIVVNKTSRSSESAKALIIADIDATLLTALFKALYHSVEHLSLERVTGCQNILPSIDQKGLKLNTLHVSNCKDLKCMIDASQLGEENSELHPAGLIQLENLEIRDAAELKQVFHGKEENEVAEEGKDIKLPNLKKLKLYTLEKLTRFFPENNHSTLPALEEFQLIECPNLTIKEGDLEEVCF
ncbi:hypothetical protein Pint_36511 [Pistacia integerrima]|uniref:Uncharacterized protein n=1 Tax=Pistacia integerrima TaxID=434235 RepID=A0ACC0Y1Q7_9ROSI|nr:hypothetical protein Pint_36511 [Pistacia integerrima]